MRLVVPAPPIMSNSIRVGLEKGGERAMISSLAWSLVSQGHGTRPQILPLPHSFRSAPSASSPSQLPTQSYAR